ncbi:MAG TPA: thiamine diphosphokinase [Bacillales bacterium]|nr:thiamine diphosphokinase [Bacillales bacterium]
MVIRIVAGGPSSLIPETAFRKNDGLWIGVDRGAVELASRGIQPDYAFGDFDSITSAERERITPKHGKEVFPSRKAKTDLHIAVDWAVRQKPERLEIYGATGGRLDHQWVNQLLLKKTAVAGVEASVIDRQNELVCKMPGEHVIERDETYPYVSFFSLGESIKGLTLRGFKYPLTKADIDLDAMLTVSNELVEKTGTYSFSSGIAMVIRSRDHS